MKYAYVIALALVLRLAPSPALASAASQAHGLREAARVSCREVFGDTPPAPVVVLNLDGRAYVGQVRATEEQCIRDLAAIAEVESGGDRFAVGDDSKSYGVYQIQARMHRVSIACATDYSCSSLWTANNLKRNGYETDRIKAVKFHNSRTPSKGKAYYAKVERVLNGN